MTYTLSTIVDHPISWGNRRAQFADLNVTSYTNGGETVDFTEVGLAEIDAVIVCDGASDSGYVFHVNTDNSTLTAYEASTDGTALDEAANATDVGQVTVLVVGRA